MSKLTQTLCILFAFVCLFSNATGSRPHPALHAPAPENPPSCDGLKFKMHACSLYLKEDSSIAEPGTSCCSGVMDVWKDNSNCSDQVFKSIVNSRHVNETRVAHVSSTCGFSDIFLDKYLASLLEARAERAEADLAEADLAEADQDEAYQAQAYQAKVDIVEVEKDKADKAKRFAFGVAAVAGMIAITFMLYMCILCRFLKNQVS